MKTIYSVPPALPASGGDDALMRLPQAAVPAPSAVVRLAAPRNPALMRLVALRRLDVASAVRAYGRKGALLRLATESAGAAQTSPASASGCEITVENERVTR